MWDLKNNTCSLANFHFFSSAREANVILQALELAGNGCDDFCLNNFKPFASHCVVLYH